tara:strand:+ start:369 stop:1001 length:633 start_codon:yes stop_codon:yes gene_type:complete
MELNRDVQILQNWFSPSFPIGSFAYSHGLETAIQARVVADPATLVDWVTFILQYGSGRNDIFFLRASHEGENVNQLCVSLSAGSERQIETLELGRAFTTVINKSYGLSLPKGLAYPVAVGMASKQLDLDLVLTLQSYLQSFATNLISVAVRSIPIGQLSGQSCLVQILPMIKKLGIQLADTPSIELGSCAVIGDLMSIQHEKSIPRLYRT